VSQDELEVILEWSEHDTRLHGWPRVILSKLFGHAKYGQPSKLEESLSGNGEVPPRNLHQEQLLSSLMTTFTAITNTTSNRRYAFAFSS
jgi:hypothetical protein